MAERNFPQSQCASCDKIIKPAEGAIYFNNYISYLINKTGTLRDLRCTLHGNDVKFINGITKEYFNQFPELFRATRSEGTAKDFMNDSYIDAGAHHYRLKKVLEHRPQSWLSIISHDDCIPKEVGQPMYYIELERIKTYEKALAWSFHLRRKGPFNPRGWILTLENLFGYIDVNKD